MSLDAPSPGIGCNHGAGQQVYSQVRDYVELDGVKFPGTIGGCSAEWTVNGPVADSLFARPR